MRFLSTILMLFSFLSFVSCASQKVSTNNFPPVLSENATRVKPVKIDTLWLHDTIWVHDTIRTTTRINDTIKTTIFDTTITHVPVTKYDTTIIKITSYIPVIIYDTTRIHTTITVTDTIHKIIIVNDTINNSSTGSSVVKFGAMLNSLTNARVAATMGKRLNIKYIRVQSALTQFDSSGRDNGFEVFTDSGFKVVPNILWQPQQFQRLFPTDTIKFKQSLVRYLNTYQPELIFIENEPINIQDKYYYGSILPYVDELNAATTIAHSKGTKVADGGLFDMLACFGYAKDLQARGLTDSLTAWQNLTFNGVMKSAFTNPNSTNASVVKFLSQYRKQDTLTKAIKASKIDFVCLHWYEPLNGIGDSTISQKNAWVTICSYLEKVIGKKVITNEVGQHNTNSNLVVSMLRTAIDAKNPYYIWYSGNTDPAMALYFDDGTLRDSGVKFQAFMNAQ
jgi:hypothetical protein